MTLSVLNDVNQLTIGRIMELIELTSTMLFLFSLCDLTCVWVCAYFPGSTEFISFP